MRSATVATMGLAMLACAARPILSATTPEKDTFETRMLPSVFDEKPSDRTRRDGT